VGDSAGATTTSSSDAMNIILHSQWERVVENILDEG
jgi:hypothetical protein